MQNLVANELRLIVDGSEYFEYMSNSELLAEFKGTLTLDRIKFKIALILLWQEIVASAKSTFEDILNKIGW